MIIPENAAPRESDALDADETAHAARVRACVNDAIDAHGGRLPFERFMELALYAPGLGYYSAGGVKFGTGGDFVTAPELSPLFARCVARQCAEVLAACAPARRRVLELGAGSGALAVELLAELERLGQPPQRYEILELSADLRERQRRLLAARLPGWLDRVRWLDALPETPLDGVIVANEVLDALPVQRFRITENGPRPLAVCRDGGALSWRENAADAALQHWLQSLQQRLGAALPLGYESERVPALDAWIAALGGALRRGLLLLIDYGYPRAEYYHPQRRFGTLICHRRQRVVADPLALPGLQDISASVDFSAVADALLGCGLRLAGYTSQSYFLFGCGLTEQLQRAGDPAGRLYLQRAGEAKRLTLPGEMGDRFKVIAATRGIDAALCGFAVRDERRYL